MKILHGDCVGVLDDIRCSLQQGIDESEELKALVKAVEIQTRVKSPASFIRKELSLSSLTKGARSKEEIYDALGVRVIALPE